MPARQRPQRETFTATEVGALIESLRKEIRIVADGFADVRKELDGFKAWRTRIDDWRARVDLALLGSENWRTSIDRWRASVDDWRAKTDERLDLITKEVQAARADVKMFGERLATVEAKVGL